MFNAKISYSELFGKFIPNFLDFRPFSVFEFLAWFRSFYDNKLIANKGRFNYEPALDEYYFRGLLLCEIGTSV